MNKRSLLISALLMISLVVVFPVVPGQGPEGYWIEVGEREIYYNVSASGDDAYLLMYQYFDATANYNPLYTWSADTMGGLVFHIGDRVNNETHREIVGWSGAHIEFWSDSGMSYLSGTITLQQIRETEIGPFLNYTDLLNRVAGSSFAIPMAEMVAGNVPDGWEGYRDASAWMFNNIFNNMIFNEEYDNDSIGFKILCPQKSSQFVYETYDSNASRAPRLFARWTLQEYREGSPPSGFSGDDYAERYRGFDLWENEGWWTNFSTFTVSGADSALISGLNDTYFNVNGMTGDDEVWIERPFIDDGSGIVNRRFGIEFTALTGSGGAGYGWYGIWGLSDTPTTWINSWGEGYAFVGRTFDASPDNHRGTAWDVEAGAMGDSADWFYSTDYNATSLPYTLWFDIWLDMNTAHYIARVYSDKDMTDLTGTWDYSFTDTPPTYSQGAFPYETLVNGWENLGSTFGYSGNYLSNLGDAGVVITDIDGDLLSDLYPDSIDETYPTLQLARDAIDRLLAGLGSDYDALPNLGNNILVIMGLMGMIMIPGSFIVFGVCVKNGDWTTGFYYLIMMFVIGIGFVSVWLFG